MTVGVEKDSIALLICSPVHSPHNVVVMPPCEFCDLLVADWAKAPLFFPERQEASFSGQVVSHLHAETLFQVDFPGRIVGIGEGAYFPMPLHGGFTRVNETGLSEGAVFVHRFSDEAPGSTIDGTEVFLPYPFRRFVGVSSFCPLPEGLEDSVVHLVEGGCTHHVSMVVDPSLNHGVKTLDESPCTCRFVRLDDRSDLLEECFHLLL